MNRLGGELPTERTTPGRKSTEASSDALTRPSSFSVLDKGPPDPPTGLHF